MGADLLGFTVQLSVQLACKNIEVEGTKSNWNKCYEWHLQEAVLSSFFEDVFHTGTSATNIVDVQQSKWVHSCV